MEAWTEVHSHRGSGSLGQIVGNELPCDAGGETVGELLGVGQTEKALPDIVDRAVAFRILKGIDRLVPETEGASLEADGAFASAQREDEARPAVAGVGDIAIGGNQRFAARHEGHARGIPVKSACVVRDGGERSAECGTAGPGAEEQEFSRGGAVGRVIDGRLGVDPLCHHPAQTGDRERAGDIVLHGQVPPGHWAKLMTVKRPILVLPDADST
jgi:hypothetical protein